MQDITTVGIGLAKKVFAVYALDATGAVVYGKVLKRDAFTAPGPKRLRPARWPWKPTARRSTGAASLLPVAIRRT